MWIQRQHVFEASMERVLDSLVRAEYAQFLTDHHPWFDEVRVLSLSQDAYSIRRWVRYAARPFFTKLGPFSIPASWFVWTEVSVLDLRTHTLTFENVPELESIRPKVINRGKMVFRALPGRRTERVSSFEIDLLVSKVYRPFVELGKQLVSKQVERTLDDEAALLGRWVDALWQVSPHHLVQPDQLLSARVLN